MVWSFFTSDHSEKEANMVKKVRFFFCLLMACVFVQWTTVVCADETEDNLQKAWSAYNNGHYKEAMEMLEPMALDGNAIAQQILGRCYENGLGTAQDVITAVKWYELAAEQKNSQAMVSLGYCYELGIGVAKDEAKACEYMKEAANAGNAEAQFNLALYYSKGLHGFAKNPEESFAWALKSAEQGYAQAECFVGACYEFGVGTNKNRDLSQEWYQKARVKGVEREGNIFNVPAGN